MRKQTTVFVGIVVLLSSLRVASAIDYTYDALNRLTKVTYDNSAYITYTYDAAGNRLTVASLGGKPEPLPASAMAGVAFEMPLPAAFASAEKIAVKGLPAGLKYDAVNRVITGVATKSGVFNVTISAAGLTPQPVTFTVEALPVWTQGAFNGFSEDGGLATMSVTVAGKITGKITVAGSNFTFSATSFAAGGGEEAGFGFETTAKAGKLVLPLTLTLARAAEPQVLGVAEGLLGGTVPLAFYRNVWKTETGTLAPYVGYYTATLPGNDEYGSGYLALTVDGAGKVKVGGKLADGTAASQGGMLILGEAGRVFAVLYTSPSGYKGGCLYGLAEFVDPPDGEVYLRPLDGAPFLWSSLNPQATSEFGAGFVRLLGLAGGWYSKTANLYDYYQNMNLTAAADTNAPAPELTVGATRYDSVCWNPAGVALTPILKSGVMTGLAAPAAGKPVDPEKDGVWDYSATNAVGLKIALARATGIFKGSFLSWFDYPDNKHVSKSLAFEGALTPEREDKADGIEGRGFFLWKDAATAPATGKAYSFSWSYDFLLLSEPVP